MSRTTAEVRTAFLDYFNRKGHETLPSSPLVPKDDPTLMFANAGMNQFKNIFTGVEKTPLKRAATAQKVVRAGGKHNDLDNVGYTARHHTFFEMLGNFSFGDYFKEGAISYAWELLTKVYGISPDKLTFTVYHTDDEAFNLWKKITGCDERRILRVPTKDNFWAMGDTGPCGPCSEIFYDHGEKAGEGEWALNPDGSDRFSGRFVEIWNLVFMQFDQQPGGAQVPLPKPSIDTGMGLERISAVLQGVHDNYEIDLFRNLIGNIETQVKQLGGSIPAEMAPFKVIADHLRSCSFLIADGVTPSNEGRGYVLRRIMRRAMRYAHQLGCKEPLMHRLAPALAREMGDAYPELKRAEPAIIDTLKGEEERFKQMLDRGLKLLTEETEKLSSGDTLPGDVAFKLYDTFGFPLDLTQDILRGQGMLVDTEGFERSMEGQREMARASWSGSGEKEVGKLWFALKEKTGSTEFLGYDQSTASAQVRAIVVDGQEVSEARTGETAYIVLDQTPFYGESGGQVGDSGFLLLAAKVCAEVSHTMKPLEGFHVHEARMLAPLKVGDKVEAHINVDARDRIRANHSATHLLHKALRDRLGSHVTQKGSMVASDRLRFDFSHGKALTQEELADVEREVNEIIWHNTPVGIRVMKPEAAIEAGAMALFGEKYGDSVRVLSMGGEESSPYSVELCGGTHVLATGDIGLFKILSEGAVAAGIRRIEAVTRESAFEWLSRQDTTMRALADSLKTPLENVPERIAKLQEEHKKLAKELAEAKKQLALGSVGAVAAEKEKIGDVTFVAQVFPELPPKELRSVAEEIRKTSGADVVMVSSGYESKASFVITVDKAVTDRKSAVPLIQAAVEEAGGKGGGGRPDMAQGGGPDSSKLGAAIDAVRRKLSA